MPEATQPLLSLRDIAFTYRALPVLRGIDWDWLPGQQWACVGPNGAGKTTLARLLCRQLQAGSGELVRGADLSERGVGYVCFEQQKSLCDRDRQLDDSEHRSDARDPGTTVAHMLQPSDPEQRERWAARMGIEHILGRGIRFISTGEMRKTLLLRSILQKPRLLILDNPLDGLDRASQVEMGAVLEELLQSDISLLLLCRNLDDVPGAVTHLLVLENGEVLDAGPRKQLIDAPAVRELMNPPDTQLGQLPSPAPRPYELEPKSPLLILNKVSVSYGEVEVLKEADWVFRPGQHSCISGPNGCGKTTLLSLINGDNHKAYGQDITLFGQRRGSGESVWEIKQKYGLLNTQLHLDHVRGMRVLEVVVSGFFDTIGLYDDWGDVQKQVATDWLHALGMAGLERESFDTLSFGMQRMVLLARAMVKSPIILILDEPCLGLDGHHTRTILRAIDHIVLNSDTQVLFVSHSAGEMPACINQWLEFVPRPSGFRLECREQT
jgi:molybdate transport system ATP-binding protein